MNGWLTLLHGRRRPQLDEAAWREALDLPVFAGLTAAEIARLRTHAVAILTGKTFSGAAGTEVSDDMATLIAAFAALPVLELGPKAYGDWREIVVYPAEFVHEADEVDEAGVVHHMRHIRAGEAMEGGPMVLSWEDVAASGGGEGYNVVIHEFAHKLDMMNGAVDGLPRLPADMRVQAWAAAFSAAYDDFCRRIDAGETGDIDPYAAESPAEFFAVLTEYFFEWPQPLAAAYPAVYEQLRRYFRQDPLRRQERAHHDLATP
ncbi:MAG: zinc-dependent peptidase [Burkholderiales bacterium]|nr:zinc-dependent peptidase [Burkholderiales bacterium]